MEEEDEISVVIVDAGTSELRAGFAGDKSPRHVEENVIGRQLEDNGLNTKYYIGNDLLNRPAAQFSREYPLEKGIVVNWDLMERVLLSVSCDHLRVSPEEHPLVLTDMTFSPQSQRDKMTEIAFESLAVPALKIVDQAAAALAFTHRAQGLVIDMGYDSIRVVPVYEGHAIKLNGMEVNYGGKDLTQYLAQLRPDLDPAVLKETKEKLCYVARDFEKELSDAKDNPGASEKSATVVEGEVTAGSERFRCAEALFDPALIGKTDPPLHKAVFDVLMTFDVTLRADFMKYILLCGGPSYTHGLAERLQSELSTLFNESAQQLDVRAPPGCNRAQYYGASYLNTPVAGKGKIFEPIKAHFWSGFVTKEHYDEFGATIAHRVFY